MRTPSLASVLALAGATALLAGAPRIQAPDAPWKTLRTAHYFIHFPAGGRFPSFAQEVASKIEGIHAQVVEWVGFEAPKPIHILIRDPQLEANGLAYAFPDRPWVELWKTPPESDGAIGHTSSWVELLVTHELTHIHHLLRPQNKPNWSDWLRKSPHGPVTRKAPRWVIEGYATVIEGRITGMGRPHSAYRAALLRQWALQGKLPDYGAVSASDGFRGGSLAYLVGSAYLEWLERQNPSDPDILKKFWKQLASKKHRDFDPSFAATFGRSAQEGYDRWRAEVTHDALELERRAKQQHLLREGEVWARFEGEVTDLSVSPDGTKLLARVLMKDFRGLKVWDLVKQEKAAPGKKTVEEKPDPNEVEDRKGGVTPQKQIWSVGRVKGQVPREPRWTPSGSIRYLLRLPNAEGSLEASAAEASPFAPLPFKGSDRPGLFRPEGRQPSTFNSGDRLWTLTFDPIGNVAADWAHDVFYGAAEVHGIWNIVRQSSGNPGPVQPLTCTLSAAWNPAPTPDGKWLYYTQLTATGVEIRRLDLTLPPLEDQALPLDSDPLAPDTVIAHADEPSRLPPGQQTPEATDYRVGDSLWSGKRLGAFSGPAGASCQLGLGGSDLLGRFSWQALASVGSGAGPRGAAFATVWHGWRWAPDLAVFSSLERPSSQEFNPLTGFDRERRGGELALNWETRTRTPLKFKPYLAFERVEALETRAQTSRALGGLDLRVGHRWQPSEHNTLALKAEASGALGRTEGQGWNLQRINLAFRFENELVPFALRGELARVGGGPTGLDRLHLGGGETDLVPPDLDLNRFAQVALPAFSATGDRGRRWRAELGAGLHAYFEHSQVWNAGQARTPATRVAGVELTVRDPLQTERLAPALGRIELTIGLHRPLDGLMKERTVGSLSLIVRP